MCAACVFVVLLCARYCLFAFAFCVPSAFVCIAPDLEAFFGRDDAINKAAFRAPRVRAAHALGRVS